MKPAAWLCQRGGSNPAVKQSGLRKPDVILCLLSSCAGCMFLHRSHLCDVPVSKHLFAHQLPPAGITPDKVGNGTQGSALLRGSAFAD